MSPCPTSQNERSLCFTLRSWEASEQNFGHSYALKNRNAGAAMANEPTIRLSKTIIEHLTKIYEKGGLALAILLIGSLIMVFAFFLVKQ